MLQSGVGQCLAASFKPRFLPCCCRCALPLSDPFTAADALGVGHIWLAIVNGRPIPLPLMPFCFWRCCLCRNDATDSPSLIALASGVGQCCTCRNKFAPCVLVSSCNRRPSCAVGVSQKRTCDSSPTVRLPFSVIPFALTISSGTLRPPFGQFGVSHSPREAEPPLPLVRGAHVGRA